MTKRPIAWCNSQCAGLGTCDEVSNCEIDMKWIVALLMFALVTTAVCRADSVAELVAQIPVKDSEAETALAAKLMAGGPAALKELCAGLVPLGTEKKDDTQTRDAISALVRYVGRKGGEADRAVLAKAL